MAVIGYLGKNAEDGVIFAVSSEKVETLYNFTWSGSARYATHERHLTNALTEFTGVDPDKITFDMKLLATLGVDPMEEITKLFTYEREGTALQLLLGEHAYGKYRWTILNHKGKTDYFDGHGNLYCVSLSVTLQEYLRE